MKKYSVFVLCILTLLFVALSSSGVGTTKNAKSRAHAGSSPAAVPGTELRGNVATVKPGYRFVSRGSSVDVMNMRKGNITGTYVCPCNSNDPARRCDLRFSPTSITCKSGSCSGTCLLSAATPTNRQ